MKINTNYLPNPKHALAGVMLAGLIASSQASAQVSYTTSGSTFTEDFSAGLATGAATPTWTDNSVFAGWYAYQTATSAAPADYRITSSGNSTKAQLYQYRPSAGSTDGAFGTRPSGGTGDMILGLRLTNDTGATLTGFTLGYTGEQWFESESTQNNQYVVAYQFGSPTDLSAGSWTDISALEFDSPKNTGADINLDGNDAGNFEVLSPVTIGSLTWADGTDLWIRWFDANSSGFDQALAIDDVSFSAVPEPSQYAIIFGLGALLLTACRRRRCK
jgi:hypothetical protein